MQEGLKKNIPKNEKRKENTSKTRKQPEKQ